MADTDLRFEPTEGDRLFAAWRVERARWELARYAPENIGADLPEDLDGMHCDADHGALMAFFLYPAGSLGELARKLRTFRDEDGHGFTRASEIVAALAEDARNLAFDRTFKPQGKLQLAS